MANILDAAKNKTVSALIEAAMSRAGGFEITIGVGEVESFLLNHTISIGKEDATGNLVISIKPKAK